MENWHEALKVGFYPSSPQTFNEDEVSTLEILWLEYLRIFAVTISQDALRTYF